MHAIRTLFTPQHGIALAFVAVSLLLIGCSEPDPAAATEARPVRVAVSTSEDGNALRSFFGQTRAQRDARLSFRVGGMITAVATEVGQFQQAGQMLARLDDTDYLLQVQSARAALQRAEAEATNAEREFERSQALYASNSTSPSAFDAARTRMDATRASADALQEQLRKVRGSRF